MPPKIGESNFCTHHQTSSELVVYGTILCETSRYYSGLFLLHADNDDDDDVDQEESEASGYQPDPLSYFSSDDDSGDIAYRP